MEEKEIHKAWNQPNNRWLNFSVQTSILFDCHKLYDVHQKFYWNYPPPSTKWSVGHMSCPCLFNILLFFSSCFHFSDVSFRMSRIIYHSYYDLTIPILYIVWPSVVCIADVSFLSFFTMATQYSRHTLLFSFTIITFNLISRGAEWKWIEKIKLTKW